MYGLFFFFKYCGMFINKLTVLLLNSFKCVTTALIHVEISNYPLNISNFGIFFVNLNCGYLRKKNVNALICPLR